MADLERAMGASLPGQQNAPPASAAVGFGETTGLSKAEIADIKRKRRNAQDKKRRAAAAAKKAATVKPIKKAKRGEAPYGQMRPMPKKRRGRPPGAKNKTPAARGRGRPPLTETQVGLSVAFSLATTLHPTDVAVFRRLVEIVTPQGPPSRARLLAALGKVFA